MTLSSRVADPNDMLVEGRRILVDTSAFLEADPDRIGGLTALVTRCAGTILERGAPLVVLTAVQRELEIKAKQPSPADNPHRKERASAALIFIRDLESDRLATTKFGAYTDGYADAEFDGIVQLAAQLGTAICLLTNDKTRKISTPLHGARGGTEQLAGRLRKDGQVEIESPIELYKWGSRKMVDLQRRGFPDRYDRERFEELSILLPEFAAEFRIPASAGEEGPERDPRPDNVRKPAAIKVEPTPFSTTVRQRTGDFELPPASIPTTGDTVRADGSAGSKTLVLGARIGRGKEGLVYSIVGNSQHVIKIFPQQFRTKHREDKVTLLVDRALRSPGICFPEARALNADGEFVGYVMRTAVGGRVLSETITNRALFKKTYPDWRKDDLVDVCLSFLKRVQSMHRLNILVGDMNEGNLMVSPNKDVWIIDTDSCQFEGYICPVGWPEFTAPELTRYDRLRTEQEELFAVAMVLFMILMTGRFAYDRADAPIMDDDDRTRLLIKEGKFPYKFKGHGDRDQPFGDAKFMWSHIDLKVKALFWETLHRDGARYKDRPTVEEWIVVFQAYKRNLASKYGWQDPMSHDVYPIRYKARNGDVTIKDCPKCGWSNGIAGWLDDYDDERVPAFCNRCATKCEGCGDPDQFNTFRDGLCKICREDDRAPAETVRPAATAKRSPKPVSKVASARSAPAPAAPKVGQSASTVKSTQPSVPVRAPSVWERFKTWFSDL